ncbi:MAG: HK97 family phage prohead protease, partial [Solirubrobacteraceae bacterium]
MNGRRIELRELEPGGPIELRGHAATFDEPYPVGSFTETIAPGAFKRTLGENPDVSLLVNHAGAPLARTTSGTMQLTEDATG